MRDKKFQFLSLISIPRNERRDLLTCIFYEAETEALDVDIVRKTFAEVGLYPWNPDHILEICQEHYCKICELKSSPLVKKLLRIIRELKQHKQDKVHQKLRRMTRARVEIVKKGCGKKGTDEEFLDSLENEGEEEEEEIGTDRSNPLEPPQKRQRKTRCCEKPCCVEGCQKTHFWSKKWAVCSKCKRNFCPMHAHLIHQHKC